MTITDERPALWSALPGWGIAADLIPRELVNARYLKALRKKMAAGIALLLALCVGGYYLAAQVNTSASSELAAAQEVTAQLQAVGRGFADVVSIQGSASQVQTQIAQLMGADVDLSALMGELRNNLPTTMTIGQESITISTAGVAANSAADGSFDTSGLPRIGTMTMNATGKTLVDAADYVDRLRAVTGLVDVLSIANNSATDGVRRPVHHHHGTDERVAESPFRRRCGVMHMSARTQDRRLWLGGGIVLSVLIVLVGWFGMINPELSAAASTQDQTESAQTQNIALQAKNSRLKDQNDNVAALRAGLAAALAELPSDDGLPAFTRQISAQATATSVFLNSIVVGAATPVAAAVTESGNTSEAETTATAGAAPVPVGRPRADHRHGGGHGTGFRRRGVPAGDPGDRAASRTGDRGSTRSVRRRHRRHRRTVHPDTDADHFLRTIVTRGPGRPRKAAQRQLTGSATCDEPPRASAGRPAFCRRPEDRGLPTIPESTPTDRPIMSAVRRRRDSSCSRPW